MRAPISGFGFSEWFTKLRQTAADFAANLSSEFAIVEIEKSGWRPTMGTGCIFWYFSDALAVLDRRKGVAMSLLKISEQVLPVRSWRSGWSFLQWPERVYIEVPVVWMFFLKSSLGLISGLRLARTS